MLALISTKAIVITTIAVIVLVIVFLYVRKKLKELNLWPEDYEFDSWDDLPSKNKEDE